MSITRKVTLQADNTNPETACSRTRPRFQYDPREVDIFGTEITCLRLVPLTVRMNSNLQAMTAVSIHRPVWKLSNISFSCFEVFNEILAHVAQ